MTDTYRIVAAISSTLARPDDRPGRPMSVKVMIIVWLIVFLGSLSGPRYYDFGALA